MVTKLPSAPWDLRREIFLVTILDDSDDTSECDGMRFNRIHAKQLLEGDLFTLEAAHEFDPLWRVPAVDRLYQALSDAYLVSGQWVVDCERC